MNDLRERLGRLADAGIEGIELTRPDLAASAASASGSSGRTRRLRPGPPVVAVAGVAVVAVVVGALVVLAGGGGGGDGDGVAAGDGRGADTVTGDEPVTAAGPPAAVVAVVYGHPDGVHGDPAGRDPGGQPGIVTDEPDLRLRFLDAGGAVVAERAWGEALDNPQSERLGTPYVERGLLQGLPAGELRLEATLPGTPEPVSCTQAFTVAEGDRLVVTTHVGLDAGPDADVACATVETVDDWTGERATGRVGPVGPIGESYLGLSLAEAEAQAEAAGYDTRVVADSGVDFAVTMDLRCDRLDLVLFDDTVIAADLPLETMPDAC